jgi:penicillin-binding protein 1A
VIRVVRDAKNRWAIVQLPEVAAAFVSLNANDGSFRAMVGGFDFALNQFDHVTQAWRQPGSSIKPFIYSAALEKGFSPSTLINDAPLALNVGSGPAWEPQNDDGSADGPISMRTGLKKSKNLVSIRILQSITPATALDHLTRFGFDAGRHPANLTMTLGTGAVTPLQMAAAYAVFANGGYQVAPYLIQKVVDARGKVLVENKPAIAGDETSRVLDPRNAYIMDSMLRDVVNGGTGYAASQRLGRRDLAGKTGTTSDAMDGWFAGYGGAIVAVAWMGYDKPRSLGGREYGGTVALPIWIDYMRTALRSSGPFQRPVPPGLAQADGDWMYEEYVNSNAVRSVGVDEIRSFWDRLFGNRTQQPQTDRRKPLPDEMIYRGGN